ncbi:hypothetical protein [Cellulomonas fengjieae]|uniref:ComEC/Rec2-related protein domain-containing protein n=1 Tax=Cellulomonas fengjieae TaxID=2819978 RepID=A0ABS3SFT2_9CELL|nr:hypothetical protein [Cellulomonas fengjieae]MBO3084613.1 hypothetical protein [Cellulomonas fengjieae]QVI67059.1 hypothetical protein KG102_05590 [Cellulomonas fengjieae]
MSRVPTAVVAAVTLVVAFTVAQLTDVRALGGVVLVAGVVWCAVRARAAGWWRIAAVVVVGAVCFAGSHLLADPLGPWPAVLVAALVLGAVTYALVDRRSARPARVA